MLGWNHVNENVGHTHGAPLNPVMEALRACPISFLKEVVIEPKLECVHKFCYLSDTFGAGWSMDVM